MDELYKFPFKHMENILSTFVQPNREYSIREIRKFAQSCGPDTREVTSMLSYILSFGKVSQNESGWIRTNERPQKPNKPRRFQFLNEIFGVILSINNNSKSIQEISSEINLDEKKILRYLLFLNKITDKGYLEKKGNFLIRKYVLKVYN